MDIIIFDIKPSLDTLVPEVFLDVSPHERAARESRKTSGTRVHVSLLQIPDSKSWPQ